MAGPQMGAIASSKWRKRTGIEPAQELLHPYTGFEDRAQHQHETRFRCALYRSIANRDSLAVHVG